MSTRMIDRLREVVRLRARRSRTLRNRANRVLRLAGLGVRVSHNPYRAYVEAPRDPAVRAALEGAGWLSWGPLPTGAQAWAPAWPDTHPIVGRKAARRLAAEAQARTGPVPHEEGKDCGGLPHVA